jgi:hypothetical protein
VLTLAVTIGCLLSAGAGGCIGALVADRPQRRRHQEERHQLWMAERMTRVSIDLARGTAMSLPEVEAAIVKAMQTAPR